MTLLYAAFAAVALWLVGELLLQRRAPLHWRALALVGFLVLVAGVVQGTLPLIGAGVLAFGAGQASATRAVKRSEGAAYWSLVDPESVPLVGRLFAGEERAPEAKGRSRADRPEPAPTPDPVPLDEADELVGPGPVPQPGAVEATAVFQADEYAVEGDSVYYPQPQQDPQQAAYYAYSGGQQASYADPYAQPYQEYAQYQQYPQYTEHQQSYASHESYDQAYGQQQYGQQYGSEYAQYGGYDAAGTGAPAQQQSGYDYEQAGYYAQDPQYHAPQG